MIKTPSLFKSWQQSNGKASANNPNDVNNSKLKNNNFVVDIFLLKNIILFIFWSDIYKENESPNKGSHLH